MAFLKDYGLTWIGGESGQRDEKEQEQIKTQLGLVGPAFRNNLPKEIDTEQLTRRIDELNFIAEK